MRPRVALISVLLASLFVAAAGAAMAQEAPMVTLSDAPGGAAIDAVSISTIGADPGTRILFIAQDGSDAIAGVSLLHSAEQGDITFAVEGADSDGKFELPAAPDSVLVTVTAGVAGGTLRAAGDIIADLGTTQSVLARIDVTAGRATPELTFDDIAPTPGVLGHFWSEIDIVVRLSAQETGQQALVFDKVTLVDLRKKADDDTGSGDLAAVLDKVTFQGGDTAIPPLTPGGGTAAFDLKMSGVDAPGRYEGTVRLEGPGLASIETDISIVVRYGWWLAALVIGVGVAVSAMLRYWLRTRRGRLIGEIRAAELRDRFETILADVAKPTPAEGAVLSYLGRRLSHLELAAAKGEDVEAEDALFQARLVVLARVLQLRAAIESSAKPDLVEELAGTYQWLRRPSAQAGEQAAQIAALEAIEDKLSAAPGIGDAVAAWRDGLPPGDLRTKADALVTELESDDGDAATALTKWKALLAEHLHSLTAEESRPQGMKDDQWQAAKTTVENAVVSLNSAATAEAVIKDYRTAVASVLEAKIGALQSRIASRSNALTDKRSTMDGETARRADALNEGFATIKNGLDEARAAVAENVDDALNRYNAAAQEYTGLADSIKDLTGQEMGEEDTDRHTLDASIPVAPPPGLGGPPEFRTLPQRKPLKELRRQLRWGETAVAVVLGLIAIVSGLQLLYFGSLTWGSSQDLLIAVLWGLGLHQVGNANFGGISELRTRFATEAQGNQGAEPAGGGGS